MILKWQKVARGTNTLQATSLNPYKDQAACKKLPLCVDLDGTLIRTDLLLESMIIFFKRNPLNIIQILWWLLKGRARLKYEVAQRVNLDVEVLPYHREFLAYLYEQKKNGRRLYLASASNERYVQAVNKYLVLFTEAWGSNHQINLKGTAKVEVFKQHLDGFAFVYAGNSFADLSVWREAQGAILVNAPRRLVLKVHKIASIEIIFHKTDHIIKTVIRAVRAHQWIKNLLLFIPMMMSHSFTSLSIFANVVVGFASFNLAASTGYLLNDLFDLEADRHHPRKRYRPLAQGDLSLTAGIVLFPITLILSIFFASYLPIYFMWIVCLYLILSVVYSFYFKKIALLDVIFLATLYSIRIIAGGLAIEVPISFWLIAFSMFLFISLAMVKRYCELLETQNTGLEHTKGRGYWSVDQDLIRSLGSSSGYIAILVLALYINSDAVITLYSKPEILWLVCPLLLYWISRIWLIANRGKMLDDPIFFTVHDKNSYLIGFLIVLILSIAK